MSAPVVVFVGAGISVPAPTKAPDFAKLRNRFLKLVDPQLDPDAFALDELSPEQVFDAIDIGSEELRQAVRRELWWLCEPNEPNANHYAVAALLAAGVTVWTPNFDTMVERAAHRLGHALDVVAAPQVATAAGAPALLKAHGSFPYTGDPPREPSRHDYRLLFQASDVWLMDDSWATRLRADIEGSELHIFGYRGADPDLTPVMLDAFAHVNSVHWWEFPTARNYARLETLLANAPRVALEAGDPSIALQTLARKLAPHAVPPARGVALTPPALTLQLSNLSKARLIGRIGDAATARKLLWRAALFDSGRRQLALFRLLRSLGYDRPFWRAGLLILARIALTLRPLQRRPRLAEFYATMLDARDIRRRDSQALEHLLSISGSQRAEVLVRVASTQKLLGELDLAATRGEQALADARQRRIPALEAMAVYNLAWTYRTQGRLDERRRFVESYRDRLPHIGFNWAAWLSLDDVLVALHLGDASEARRILDSPFVAYARLQIRHPRFRLDDDLNATLVAWHERGPDKIEAELERILRRERLRPLVAAPFTAIDTVILLADHARACGDESRMHRHLQRARRRAQSPLQLAKAELVRVVASGDNQELKRLQDGSASRGFGLIAQSAESVLSTRVGRTSPLAYAPPLPLAGLY